MGGRHSKEAQRQGALFFAVSVFSAAGKISVAWSFSGPLGAIRGCLLAVLTQQFQRRPKARSGFWTAVVSVGCNPMEPSVLVSMQRVRSSSKERSAHGFFYVEHTRWTNKRDQSGLLAKRKVGGS